MERCETGSNSRIDSISSPENSARIGLSPANVNTSRIPPLREKSPCVSTKSFCSNPDSLSDRTTTVRSACIPFVSGMTFSDMSEGGGSGRTIPCGEVTTTAAAASTSDRSACTSGTPPSPGRNCAPEGEGANRWTASVPRRRERSSRILSADASSPVTRRTWHLRLSLIPATMNAAREPAAPVTVISRVPERSSALNASRSSIFCRSFSIIAHTKNTPPLRRRL